MSENCTKVSNRSYAKFLSPNEIISMVRRNRDNRKKILQQLEQIDYDTSNLQNLPLNDLYRITQQILSKTYSIKYIGNDKTAIGILSRRIDPNKSIIQKSTSPQLQYNINRYFYPKPLRTIHKIISTENLNTQNLQNSIKEAFQSARNKRKQSSKDLKNKTSLSGSWINLQNKLHYKKSSKENQDDHCFNKVSFPQVKDFRLRNSISANLRKGLIIKNLNA